METLHEKFLAACEYYAVLGKYDECIEQAKKDVANVKLKCNKQLSKIASTTGESSLGSNIKIICIVVGIALLLDLIFFATESALAIVAFQFLNMVTPIVCLLLCLRNTSKIRKENAPLVEQAKAKWLAENGEELNAANIEYEALVSEKEAFIYNHYKVIDFLPPDYREPYPVYYMESLVRKGRAESMKETINLFEEMMHRKRLEANSAQMLAQTESLRSQIAQWRIENNVHSIINHAQLTALNRNVRDIYDKFD